METHPLTSSTTKIESLLSLINSAAKDAMQEYEKTGFGVPDPGSTERHPLDSSPDALLLKKAIRTLEGACEMLCSTLAQPMHTITNRSMHYESSCLRLVTEKKIADILQDVPRGLHVEYIAEIAGVDGGKLLQILRLLASRGCFAESSPDVFANNRLSLTLISSSPIAALVGLNAGECLQAMNVLPETMTDPEYAFSNEASKSAFMFSVRHELGDPNAALFDWYGSHRFNAAMIGWSTVTGALSLVNNFPWHTFPPGTTFCDVGCGVGALTVVLAKTHRNLNFILQDLPGPLNDAVEFWRTVHPGTITGKQVDFVPFDFLKESPVKDQDIYYMKHIIHDWPDADAVTILRNVRAAMHPYSRLLIRKLALDPRFKSFNVQCSFNVQAPEPLLPDYGTGTIRMYNQNMNMVAMFNSKERTYNEICSLGVQAGLQVRKVWDLVETSVLELVPLSTRSSL
ncbi:S-adenosyl-L-methionine-dependent methyltransferase [Mycena floridula]|nr:S-adenosyl-L-methionine-dependent methyltransferase [Mycena floridula]